MLHTGNTGSLRGGVDDQTTLQTCDGSKGSGISEGRMAMRQTPAGHSNCRATIIIDRLMGSNSFANEVGILAIVEEIKQWTGIDLLRNMDCHYFGHCP